MLLIRTNDWVKPVQELALSALRARLRPECLPDLIGALPMLEQMRKWGRLRDRSILDDIDRLLCSPDGTTLLRECRKSDDRYVRRAAFRRLADSPRADLHDVFKSALADGDPAIRSWAGRRLCDSEAADFLQYAEKLLSNSLGAIRMKAAQRLVKLEHSLPWERLLFDSHSGVRSVAQQVALAEGGAPDGVYRSSIPSSHGARLGAALIGLSETGVPDDMGVVRKHLSNDAPRVRRSCLHALANLKADDLGETCLAALSDPSPGVTHAARDLLVSGAGYVAPASVWEAFETAGTPWGKRDALSVLSNLDYWTRLPYLLRAFVVEDDDVKERAALYLTQWVARQNRVFTSPSEQVARQARELVHAPQFSAAFKREVTAVLDTRSGGPERERK
jgi:HEAT repeat protein